jgi:hypothetical protein
MSQRRIMEAMRSSRSVVRGAIALYILNTNGNSMPRPGRPRIYLERDRRATLRNLRLYSKLTFQ